MKSSSRCGDARIRPPVAQTIEQVAGSGVESPALVAGHVLPPGARTRSTRGLPRRRLLAQTPRVRDHQAAVQPRAIPVLLQPPGCARVIREHRLRVLEIQEAADLAKDRRRIPNEVLEP